MQKIIWIFIASLPFSVFGQNLDPLRDSRKHFFWGIAFTGSSARMKIALDNDFFNQNPMELKKILNLYSIDSAATHLWGILNDSRIYKK